MTEGDATSSPSHGFIHLCVHSAYSLAEGAIHLNHLVKLCQQYQMPAVAVTDTHNLFGALEFSAYCAAAGIQPIIACRLFIRAEEDAALSGRPLAAPPRDVLAVYVQDETGYRNLLHLVSRGYIAPCEENAAPLLAWSDLEGYTDGLIALTAGTEGAVGRQLLAGRAEQATESLCALAELFPGRLYVELQRHGLAEEARIENELIDLAYAQNLPLVATNGVYFPQRDMYEAHDALLCIADGRYVGETDRRRLTPEHYFKSPAAMAELFADIPEAIYHTGVIAQRCAFRVPEHNPMLPRFSTADGYDEAAEFRTVARKGLNWRLDHFVFTPQMDEASREVAAQPYRERLEFELDTIAQMQFAGYFLIVSDFIRWSKEHGIPVGPGRGSGAGSLVAWAMQITDLDPLRFGLLFERFLNPERVSMPDFDIDFCQERRDETIRYVQRRYGSERVAQIITFGKLQARAVLRDVGRVLQMPYPQVDRISKLVPHNPASPVTLQEAIDLEPMLQEEIRKDEQVARMTGIALKLEGLYRHASTHAAGVVIADRPLHELVPLYRDPKSDMPVVQFSMKYAEMAGLVKFDFLGLKTLTVLARACELVQQTRGVTLDLLKLPLNDPATYAMLAEGHTVGIFQLESAGMRDTLRKLRPDCIEDIIALVSLYRPGPMDNIPTYIARKHGREKPDYPHPMLEQILKETFGVIIYQEQVMQIAQVMAGYSLGQADLLRRAMGKKIKAEMDAQRDSFIQGAIAQNVPAYKAEEVFELMAKFASYGFNKSHAAAYALIAFQTAYLKTHYPVEFLAASMSLDYGNTDKLSIFRQDAQRLGIPLLPPDMNQSGAAFTVESCASAEDKTADQSTSHFAIRYALGALKNVGMNAMQSLVEERDVRGVFADLYDFAARLDGQVVNKRQLEYLVKAGAFDSLHPNRRQLFESTDRLTQYSAAITEEKASNQVSLFGEESAAHIPPPMLAEVEDWPLADRLHQEFQAVGFYLSAHPLDVYGDLARRLQVTRSDQIAARLEKGGYTALKVAGIVVGRKVKVSPRGRFAFLSLTDPGGLFEVSLFDEQMLAANWDLLENGTALCVSVEGKIDESAGIRLSAQRIQRLDDVVQEQGKNITITLTEAPSVSLPQLRAALEGMKAAQCRGSYVILELRVDKNLLTIALPDRYNIAPPQLAALEHCAAVAKVKAG